MEHERHAGLHPVGSAAFFEAIVNTAVSPFVVIDRDLILRFVSESATALLGWKPDEWVGRSIAGLLTEDSLEVAAAGLGDLNELPEDPEWVGAPVRVYVKRSDGTTIPIDAAARAEERTGIERHRRAAAPGRRLPGHERRRRRDPRRQRPGPCAHPAHVADRARDLGHLRGARERVGRPPLRSGVRRQHPDEAGLAAAGRPGRHPARARLRARGPRHLRASRPGHPGCRPQRGPARLLVRADPRHRHATTPPRPCSCGTPSPVRRARSTAPTSPDP